MVGIEDEQDDEDDEDDEEDDVGDGEEDEEGEDEEDDADKNVAQEAHEKLQVDEPLEAKNDAPQDTNDNTNDENLPQPGETLRQFFERTKDIWVTAASHKMPEASAKELRGVAFTLAEDKYEEHRPVLREIEAMIRDSGAEPIAAKAQQQPGAASRNRR